MDKGMIMTGGGSLLRNIEQLISKTIAVPCFIGEAPLFCVIKGVGVVLENLDFYKKSLTTKK